MDIQPSLLGYISIAKDWLTLIIAGCGVWVAWQGLKTWRRQLKGTSQFDVAKRLMLKVYQIRRDIEYCRESYRSIPVLTQYQDGKPIPESEQERYSRNKEMLDRYNVIVRTLSEIEFILFESEIILDKKARNIFKPIEDVCYLLRYSIDEYIIVCDPRYKDMSGSEDSSNQYRELLRVIFSKKMMIFKLK